jgi:hypothetical protein
MPRVVTTVHDPIALAAACRQLGLAPPVQHAVALHGEKVYGWVIRLPGLRFPLVLDTLSGLVAYHPRDGVFHRFGPIRHLIGRYYALRAQCRYGHPVRTSQLLHFEACTRQRRRA